MKEPFINITKDILRLVAELDEFKGEWKALGNLAPDRLKALKKIGILFKFHGGFWSTDKCSKRDRLSLFEFHGKSQF
jgi:hypothetical protein